MAKQRLAIFDLDGTLCYTIEDILGAVHYALEVSGADAIGKERIRPLLGKSIRDIFMTLLPDETKDVSFLDNLVKEYNTYYLDHCADFTTVYPGVCELLSALKKEGFALAVATNKSVTVASAIIAHFFPDVFDIVRGNDGVTPLKPNPEVIHQLEVLFHASDESTFYIGDTEIDYKTACNAHVQPIIVTYGYRSEEELRASVPVEFLYSGDASSLLKVFLADR